MKENNQPICQVDQFGTKFWLLNGQYHREDGPAVEWADGSKFWYFSNLLHKLDGPAAEYADGDKHWFLHGKLHRLDGPAYEGKDGYKEWYYYGEHIKCFSQKEFKRLIKLKALW